MTTGPSNFLYLPPVRPVLALHLCFLLRRSAVEVLWAKKLHNTELRKNARAILWVHQLRHWNQIPNPKEKKSRISVWKTWAAGIGSCCNRISENPFVLATANQLQWSPKHTVEYLFFSSFMNSHECYKKSTGCPSFQIECQGGFRFFSIKIHAVFLFLTNTSKNIKSLS